MIGTAKSVAASADGDGTVTAFDELQTTGKVGPVAVAMLIRLVGQVTRTSSFPAPAGYPRWTEQAVLDHVGVLLSRKSGTSFIIAAAVKATDQNSLERLVLASIRNDLIDEAKATPVGKLRRRLRTLLGNDERFLKAHELFAGDEAWSLVLNMKRPWNGDHEELATIAADIHVADIANLPPSGPTPRAAKESLMTLCFEALNRLNAAVRAQTLARFLATRFGIAAPTVVTGHEGTWTPSVDATDDPSDNGLADAIYAELSADERWLVAVLDDPAAIRQKMGEGGVRASDVLRDKLRRHAGSEDGRTALGALARRCESGHRS